MNDVQTASPEVTENTSPVFSIEKIYIKDLSVENPNAPQSFMLQTEPEIQINLQSAVQQVDEHHYEAALTITVQAKADDKTVFLVEVAQAGVFQLRNIPDTEMGAILGVHCPTILFPYAREVVTTEISRAGFPPVNLQPINFEALYMQQLAQQQASGDVAPTVQ